MIVPNNSMQRTALRAAADAERWVALEYGESRMVNRDSPRGNNVD